MSQHNIVGSEVFDPQRLVYILRTYPRRTANWPAYFLAAGCGSALAFVLAGVMIYAGRLIGH
jgi:hypothetical protein